MVLNVEHAASLVHVRFNLKRCINKPAACSTFKTIYPPLQLNNIAFFVSWQEDCEVKMLWNHL